MDEAILQKIAIDLNKEALERGYSLSLPTLGMSMFPLLKSTEKIIVRDCPVERLCCGDVILYRSGEKDAILIAHRLIRRLKRKDDYLFITKGDSQTHCDRPISSDLLIAKVIKIKKAYFDISLEGFKGQIINFLMLFLSLSMVFALCWMLRKRVNKVLFSLKARLL